MIDLWKACESAWRAAWKAGLRQFRHMRTLQRNRANLITPF